MMSLSGGVAALWMGMSLSGGVFTLCAVLVAAKGPGFKPQWRLEKVFHIWIMLRVGDV